jgi:hypothetical protein
MANGLKNTDKYLSEAKKYGIDFWSPPYAMTKGQRTYMLKLAKKSGFAQEIKDLNSGHIKYKGYDSPVEFQFFSLLKKRHEKLWHTKK